MSSPKDLARLRTLYRNSVMRGVPLSVDDLLDLASEKGLTVSGEDVESLKKSSRATVVFTRYRKPVKFIAPSVLRYGTVSIDLAFFNSFRNADGKKVDWSNYNYGYVGFILAVEVLSGKMSIFPVKSGQQEEWKNAVRYFLTDKEFGFPGARAILSDRDSSVTGKKFRQHIEKTYGVTWVYLVTTSKSAYAERGIRTAKTAFSMGLRAKIESGKGGAADRKKFNWADMVPNFLRWYNAQPVPNTGVPRSKVTAENEDDVLTAKMKAVDATVFSNTRQLDELALGSEENIARAFKFNVGDRVVLARDADFDARISETPGKDDRKKRKDIFEKRSVYGSYSDKIHVVSERMLKSARDQTLLPVYRLKDMDDVWLYERQLRAYKGPARLPPL